MNYELEYQSSASAPMICTVSLWKSSHACSDGAKVLDSTVTNRFNARIFDCVSYYFTIRFRVLRGINRCVCVFTACYIQ